MNLEQLVADALQERTERTTYPATPHSDVVERAAAIGARRRHRALSAAAAVAVVVPIGLAGPSITHLFEAAPTAQPGHHGQPNGPGLPTFAEIPRGPAAAVPYLAGDTYVLPDGTTRLLPTGAGRGADWVVPLGSSFLLHSEREVVTRHSDGSFSTLRLVQDGTVTELGCGSNSYGTDEADSRVAYWVANRCSDYRGAGTLYVVDTATGEVTQHLPTDRALGAVQPVGIVDGRVVAEADRSSATSVVSIGPDGSVHPVPGLHDVFGFDPVHRWVIGIAPSGRHVMLDPLTGDVEWSTPENGWVLNSVSPDGRYVLGIWSGSGLMSKYALLDATDGHLVARIHPQGPPDFGTVGAEIRGTAWDHGALLSNVVAGHQNGLLRSDATGHTTVATDPVPYRTPVKPNVAPSPSFYGLSGS